MGNIVILIFQTRNLRIRELAKNTLQGSSEDHPVHQPGLLPGMCYQERYTSWLNSLHSKRVLDSNVSFNCTLIQGVAEPNLSLKKNMVLYCIAQGTLLNIM